MAAAYAGVRRVVARATRAAMSDTWGQQESEAFRRILAGDLPIPADEAVGLKTAKYVEKKVVNAIRHLQGVVADGKAAWLTASNKERARRAEERALQCMRAGVMWQWQQAGIIEEQRRTRIARAWRRHRAMYNREEWGQHMEERRTQGRQGARAEAGRGGEGRGAVGKDRRLTPSTEDGSKRKGRRKKSKDMEGGWTMAGTLIRYMKGQRRERDMLREGKEDGTKEGTESAHARSVEEEGERTEEETNEVGMEGGSARSTQEAQDSQRDGERVRETERESGSEGEGGRETAQGSSTQQTQEQHPEEMQDSRVGQQSTRTAAAAVEGQEEGRESEHGDRRGGKRKAHEGYVDGVAHGREAPWTPRGKVTTHSQGGSEEESMRTGSEAHGSMRYGDGTCEVEGEQSMPRRSAVDGSVEGSEEAADGHAPIEGGRPSEPVPEPGGPPSSVPKGGGVKAGYEGRARRGNSKEGGYDMTPTRRGPRKPKEERIRYIENEERGGGTTEQGIRMGPVSVMRAARAQTGEVESAATPLRDPG